MRSLGCKKLSIREDLFGWMRWDGIEAELTDFASGEHTAGVVGWEPCKEINLPLLLFFFLPVTEVSNALENSSNLGFPLMVVSWSKKA